MKDDFLVVWSARRVMRVRWGDFERAFRAGEEEEECGGDGLGKESTPSADRGVRFSKDESQELKCIFVSDLFSCESLGIEMSQQNTLMVATIKEKHKS